MPEAHASPLPKAEGAIRLENSCEPQVSFDIKLGKQLSFIDFDTTTYIDRLRDRGLNDEQIGKTKIHFASAPIAGAVDRADYNPESYQQTVRISRITSGRTASKAVFHETEHHIAKVTETSSHIGWPIASKSLLLAAGLSAPTSIGAVRTGEMLHSSELSHSGFLLALGTFVFAAAGLIANYGSPEERRALKAARNKPRIVDIVR